MFQKESDHIIFEISCQLQIQGINQNQLAKKLEWNKSRLSKYMNKKVRLTVDIAQEIFEALGKKLHFTIGDK